MKDRYAILTGSKNNAGDFLIKFRAKELFRKLRSDRDLVDFNAWEPFNGEKLEIINDSKALILVGGPSLQKRMRPNIYKMTGDLNDIHVPIISMGIGWKSPTGDWSDTYDYELSKESIDLLRKIDNSGFISSVRDYHTLNVLWFKGFDNFIMTGCPAYYDFDFLGSEVETYPLTKVAFSLGVSFIHSISAETQIKENILKCNDLFNDNEFEVVFHHSLEENPFISKRHVDRHNQFASWLEKQNINYTNISGSADRLIEYYSRVDMHIGYRLHAHIFMNSISRLSILISEDGRGKAAKDVVGGIVLDSVNSIKSKRFHKIITLLNRNYDRILINKHLPYELIENIKYEESTDYIRIKSSRKRIDQNFVVMKQFMQQLP